MGFSRLRSYVKLFMCYTSLEGYSSHNVICSDRRRVEAFADKGPKPIEIQNIVWSGQEEKIQNGRNNINEPRIGNLTIRGLLK